MKHYVGLDVSEKVTLVSVVDGDGKVLFKGREITSPAPIARRLRDWASAPLAWLAGRVRGLAEPLPRQDSVF